MTSTFWRPTRDDVRAMLLVALIPILLALPQLTPWLNADPLYYTAGIDLDRASPMQRGVPYMDPNNGFQTQALGYRAARDWLGGEVPWWNPYSGIGMPLAAEYQPAAFFPLTLVILLPRGMVLLQMALQILAGLGTYALLRQLGLSRLASTCGGVLYAMNGTLAWLAHGPAGVVPSLPWILLAIEHAAAAASRRATGGWKLLAAAMAMSLLAGFPETAYINGLLALAWAILRGLQLRGDARAGFALRVAGGGLVALMLASPQIVSFFLYLRDADIEGHATQAAGASLPLPSALSSLVAPYIFGPIFGYAFHFPALQPLQGMMGGFVTIALISTALYGLFARRDALSLLLAAWIASTIAKSFALEPFLTLWNLVPGVTETWFARYAQPSWTLALVILAANSLDALQREGPRRAPVLATGALSLIGLAVAIAYAMFVRTDIPQGFATLRVWFFAAETWAALSTAMVMLLIVEAKSRRAIAALAVLLAGEATLFCAIPILSNPRGGRLDMEAIGFLRANLGLQRFYTLLPIAPNYGAYFGIASINHNYLPIPRAWVSHVQTALDRTWKEPSVFNGDPGRNSQAELRANLPAYADLGVKYVVAYPHQDPLAGVEGVTAVYSDPIIKIFEVPGAAPYFEALEGPCTVEAIERRRARVDCKAPATLVRRELHFPGWTATVNGEEAPLAPHKRIFQSVALPQGASEVRFRYAPPHIGWAWLAAFLGLAALVTPLSLLRRKNQ